MSFFSSLAGIAGIVAAPFTGGLSLALTAGAIGLEAYGAHKEGQAQAKVANTNATIADERRDIQATMQRRAGINAMGETLTGFGNAGVQRSGTVLDVLAQNARDSAFDAATIQRLGDLEVGSLRSQAKRAKTASYMNAASALISGVAGAYGKTSSAGSTPSYGLGPNSAI